MYSTWTSSVVLSALAITAVGIFIWNRRKKNFVKVGKIAKLLFFPVKSLKAVEVTHGKCTRVGFEVNGITDRSFMLVDVDGKLVSQRTEPSLVLLTPEIKENFLIINATNRDPLKVEILQSPSPNAKMINCDVHSDNVGGVDCGDEAAFWFQSYLGKKEIRLVRFFPSCTVRRPTKKNAFYDKIKKEHPVAFQDDGAFHMLSQSSIDDLNSRIGERKVSVFNFRPNVLIDDCEAYAEDSWKYVKFPSEAVLLKYTLTTRCLLTTNDPETGILSQKEPLVTLRKYRIPSDPALLKVFGSIPCLGVTSAVLSPGEISVGDEIFAVVEKQPGMQERAI